MIVPSSTPAELQSVWDRIAEAKCFARRSPSQKQWLTLVRGVSNRDAASMIAASERILASGAGMESSKRARYALRSAILGSLVAGKLGDGTRLWRTYGAAVFTDGAPLDVRLMLTLDEPNAYRAWRTLFAARLPLLAAR